MTGVVLLLSRLLCAAAALTAVTPPAATPPAPPPPPAALPREAPSAALVARPWSMQATPPPAPSPSPEPPDLPAPADDFVGALPDGGSGLLVPVRGVRPEDLVDTFTAARGEGRTHDAIDIPAPKGTPVVAAAGGTVAKKFQSERGGLTLYVLLPDGQTVHYYAHLDRYADGIAEGQTIRQGETLGFVGDTGNAGAGNYHLHFEVSTTTEPDRYWGGASRNPYPLLVSPPQAPGASSP